MRSNGSPDLCVGFNRNFFDRNVNFREILFLRFPPCIETCSRRRNARWRIPSG
jgi:hypothetical protein